MRSASLPVVQAEKLPCDSCGGKCCIAAPFSAAELRRARIANGGVYPVGAKVIGGMPIKSKFGGGSAFLVVKDADLTCAFLMGGRCSIYEARPLTCQQYGLVPELPCMELHPEKARAIAAQQLREIREALS